jgi:hypothetical protein
MSEQMELVPNSIRYATYRTSRYVGYLTLRDYNLSFRHSHDVSLPLALGSGNETFVEVTFVSNKYNEATQIINHFHDSYELFRLL